MQSALSSHCRRGAVGRRLLILGVVLPLLSLASAALAQTTPKALPPLDGDTDSVALAINNRGEIAGNSGSDDLGFRVLDNSTAVVWDRKGTPKALLPLPGDAQSGASGINNRGEVAGNSGDFGELFDSTAVRWDRKGVALALPPLPGGDDSWANGINAGGEVVGTSVESGVRTAVIWDGDGLPRALPPLPGDSVSLGKAINNQGMAAGQSLGPGGTRAVVWSRDGTPRELPPLDGHISSEAWGINWRGEVAGMSKESEYDFTVVIWDRTGEPRALEAPVYENEFGEPNVYSAYAYGIDPTREVAGYDHGGGRAVLWDRSGTLIGLPWLEGDELGFAYAINNRGEVAGLSVAVDSETDLVTYTAVVWR